MDERQISLADAFLREAVYRSRAQQAAANVIAAPSPSGGQCGLGERAEVALDLTERGRELFTELFGERATAARIALVRDVMRDWTVEQDALDRRRNHFLKAFRNEHGFDRTQYSAALSAQFEAGLVRVNREEDRERRAHIERLLASE